MLLISPPTYIAAVLFVSLMGFLYWAILRGMINTPEESLPIVQFLKIFWIPVFFVVPLLTMRSVAGERSTGTLDTLMTTPTSRVAVILSKFSGAYIFYMLLWLSTLSFPLIASKFFPSSITRSQLVAGMLSFTTLFVAIIGGQQLGNIAENGAELAFWASELVNYLQIFEHLDDFSRGVIDTRPFFYYISTGALLLGLSTLVIEAKA
jgi:ABC-2 type transport system permease protein